ncbi:DUF2827 domain-containing protein [Variovorax sp. J22G21]|uniref:DUF2827 domain-containing protein n=1 Tax=Variovorax fucosicus TaxID=3053517 RepID=UPI002574C36C|nr:MULTISPECIES: DUF2827 domain-containing protein [unclassified Variovorax]MDM0039027.1 DUF2827 domain-containing protein [Variovorax sp. J22R193]MDM0055376.1 DUF2827 domain-containing protein [Variovorax sp. J22G47]MDM0063803.1 DUF2827 domain-containing protein [Variovorax sp. J22G21]
MATNTSLRVGITIGLHHEAETLWNNGIKQNAVFLAEALKHCPAVASVVLVNTTAIPITPALPWDQTRWPTVPFESAKDSVDVLIELGGQIGPEQTDYLKRRGTRLVSYCCGCEYVSAMESMLFNKPLWGQNLFVNRRYDDIWMVPQVANISQPYFEVLRRAEARPVPFVWSPVFLDERTRDLPHAGIYHPHAGPRRLSVMEPNINVVKFCLYPVFIAELAYRTRPEAIAQLQVTNAERPAKESMEFITLMNQLDLIRDHKAVFLGRHETPVFLAQNTDIVVSHQWENPLNYFYLETCWQGYALVHNAHLCADLGYYYPGNDVAGGSARLLEAIDTHDAQAEAYRERQRGLIGRYLPGNAAATEAYNTLLLGLMQRTAL